MRVMDINGYNPSPEHHTHCLVFPSTTRSVSGDGISSPDTKSSKVSPSSSLVNLVRDEELAAVDDDVEVEGEAAVASDRLEMLRRVL